MENIKRLEAEYLQAKMMYYSDEFSSDNKLSDSEFDALEKMLKDAGSKVVEQVGTKRKDFDFAHPSKMLSLEKIQTEKTKEGTDYKEEDFQKWYLSNCKKIGTTPKLLSSCKFDGNAINIIYRGTKLFQTITRGDGFSGKNVSDRFNNRFVKTLKISGLDIKDSDNIEIRAEVVIPLSIFDEKYKGTREEGKFANARNYVAGVIGKDDFDKVKVSELDILPVHFIVNGKQVSQKHFELNDFCKESYETEFDAKDFIKVIKSYEELRKNHNYLLDGVVISFPTQYREIIGLHEHHPEWSIAIKPVSEEVVTEYDDIEWNVSKRGELTPVILLKPVILAGTVVKRASGYNAGYIVNNQIGPGALVVVAKAGEIIPEVQKVIVKSDEVIKLPTHCPACQTKLEFDNIHLMCQNENCVGRISKKLSSAAGTLDLKGVGGKTLEPFASDFPNMFELMKWVLTHGYTQAISLYGIEYKSRSHEIFVNAFNNIKSLTYEKVIIILGYENVGKKLSIQIAKEHAGLTPDYSGLERALVDKLHEPEVENYIKQAVSDLETLGITIDRPENLNNKNMDKIGVCLTGSPRVFNFKTKADFLIANPSLYEVDLKDQNCKYLITDDYSSTSSKMKDANKRGITIKTYGDINK